MHIINLLLFLLLITACHDSSGGRMPATRTFETGNEFHSFLKEGLHKAEFYPSKEVTSKQKRLLQNLSKLFETNKQTQKYFHQIEEGGKPEYNSHIGINRDEYNLLTDLFSYKVSEKFTATLFISKEGNRFTFKGDGRLSLLDSVTVNMSSTSATFKQYTMNRVKDDVDLTNEYIPLSDTLASYEFYSGPDGILGLTGSEGVYELLIGKLMPGGRTYLSFFAKHPYSIGHPIPEYITVILD